MAFDAFPAPPRYSHAINLGPYVAGRPQTPKSAQSLGSDGRDDVTRVDSDDELVERYVAESMRVWMIDADLGCSLGTTILRRCTESSL